MRRWLAFWITDMIYKEHLRFLTYPLSWFYGWGISLFHWLYDHKWWLQKYAPLPVVSIGNVVVGGVGKTQLVILLAKELNDVAILSRGYRGKHEKGIKPTLVRPGTLVSDYGDEPCLLASRLPDIPVIVHRDRYKGALEAKRLGARLVLMDDGMQHRALHREIEIVVLNGKDPWGGGHFLPRGRLREHPKRLKEADLIVFVGTPSLDTQKRVRSLTKAPWIEVEIVIREIRMLNETLITSLQGKRIGIFCGIGNPIRFAENIQTLGGKIVKSFYLPDHYGMNEKELKQFAIFCKAKGAEYLVCTEKDRVKLPLSAASSPLPICWAKAEFVITKNQEAWNKMKKQITTLVGMI
ncbi:MAG: tetraacyldisaccharide 4'-kinase [Chlamydiales bacterium]